MQPNEVVTLLGAVMLGVGAVVARLPVAECNQCPHCAQAKEDHKRTQAEMRHDIEHKGAGYGHGTPDRYHCTDDFCPRNRRR